MGTQDPSTSPGLVGTDGWMGGGRLLLGYKGHARQGGARPPRVGLRGREGTRFRSHRGPGLGLGCGAPGGTRSLPA